MTGRDADETHRASSPLEALFDLTFVVAVAQVAGQLGDAIKAGDGLQAIVPFIMVFFAIWWAWMNFTWFASAYDTDDVPYRLLALVQMGGVLVLAAGVPAAFHQNFFGITLGYFIMRIGLVAQWVRAAIENPDGRTTALRYAIGVTVVQIFWLCRLLLPTDPRDAWWTVYLAFFVLVVLEFLVPVFAERSGMTSWHPHHVAERFGLFAIILLGETISILALGVGAVITTHHSTAQLVTVGAGLEVVLTYAGGRLILDPEVVVYSVAIPVAIFLVALLVAHLRILPGIIIHVRIVVPTTVVVLALPLAVGYVGVPVDFAAIALVVAAAVAATLILGRRYTAAS